MPETRYRFVRPRRDEGALDAEVRSLGLPGFVGLCGSGDEVQAVFADPLAQADRDRLQAAVSAHAPPAKRRPKQLDALAAQVSALSAADRQRLTAHALAYLLRQEPRLARQAGVDLDGDEPAPDVERGDGARVRSPGVRES